MGANHSTFCFKPSGEEAAKRVKFAANGGLQFYNGVRASDLIIVPQDESEDSNEPPWIDYFSVLNCYHIYSWLCDYRGDVMPMAGYESNKKCTKIFIDWMDMRARTGEVPDIICNPKFAATGRTPHHYTSYYQKYPLSEQLMMDEGAIVMYSLEFLLNYDYDQVAQMQDEDEWDSVNMCTRPTTSVPHPEGKTYRQLFDKDYFKFLELAVKNGYTGVMFVIQ